MQGASATEARARRSLGSSTSTKIYAMVARVLRQRVVAGRVLVDVGCGHGHLRDYVSDLFDRYVGADVVRYDEFPSAGEFHRIDLDTGRLPTPDGFADVSVAVETIEHLENPRALMRELVRLTRPGGWVVVTTPNQRSFLSLATLVAKGQFSSFQDNSYPAHISALLDVDLVRMARECGLEDISIEYSESGRMIGTPLHYPTALSRLLPRLLSDNLLVVGRRGPAERERR